MQNLCMHLCSSPAAPIWVIFLQCYLPTEADIHKIKVSHFLLELYEVAKSDTTLTWLVDQGSQDVPRHRTKWRAPLLDWLPVACVPLTEDQIFPLLRILEDMAVSHILI